MINKSITNDYINHVLCVQVEAGGDLWTNALDKSVNKLAKQITVKGFRKGHAPIEALKGKVDFRKAAADAINVIAPQVYNELLKQEKIQNQNILEDVFDANVISIFNDKILIEYKFAYVPEVTLLDYKHLGIDYNKPTVTDDEIDNTIRMFDKKIAYFGKKNDKAKENKLLTINFHGTVNGKPFPGSDAKDYDVELGSGELLPGFEEEIKDLKKGDTKSFSLKIPADHFDSSIAGKVAQFYVEVLNDSIVYHTNIDDEFAKNLHVKGVTDLKSLREFYRDLLFIQKNATEYNRIKNIFFKKIISDCKLNYIPEKLLNFQKQSLLNNYKQEAKNKNLSLEEYIKTNPSIKTLDNLYDVIDKQVHANIVFMFAIDKLYEELNIQANDKDLEEELILLMKETDASDAEVKAKYSNKELLTNMVLQRKLITKIIELNTTKK